MLLKIVLMYKAFFFFCEMDQKKPIFRIPETSASIRLSCKVAFIPSFLLCALW